MTRRCTAGILFFIFFSLFISQASASSKIINHKISFETLGAGWELYLEKSPEQTFELADKNIPADFTVTVPHNWNLEVQHFGGASPNTYGCYRYVCTNLDPHTKYALHMRESPGTASAFFINRSLITQTGDPFIML